MTEGPREEMFVIDRRTLLRRAGAGAAVLAVPGWLAACGGDDSPGESSGTASTSGLKVSGGAEIPQVTVRFGMAPFADATFYVIAMKRGWFEDVGIDIQPQPTGLEVTPDNVTSKLVTGEADIATFYGPGKIATMAKAPQLKMFGFSDTYTGTYLLASPDSGLQPVSELVEGGMPFEEALKEAMAGVKGKGVGLDNTGQHRDFLNQAFMLGGITFDDVELTVTTDPKILSLANSGRIEFASPVGAAQNIALINDGWFPLVAVDDLLSGLPPGDKRAVAGIGHEGPACSQEYYEANTETCLRFLSVMFRTIDAILEAPDEHIADQAPYLTSVTGVETTVEDIKGIYDEIDPLIAFEEQTQYWTDVEGPRSYKTIYGAQIESAQAGGVLPKGKEFTPEDAVIGKVTYDHLVKLKKDYEELRESGGELSGEQAQLAKRAAEQYDNRNYLDAYRLQKAATA